MQKLDRSKLLQFLAQPRYAREIANYLNISGQLVNYHLKEWVKSGQVLVSEKHVSGSFLNLRGRLKKMNDFLYVSRNSPLLTKGSLQLVDQKDEKSTWTTTKENVRVKFISTVRNPREKDLREQEISTLTHRKTDPTRTTGASFERKVDLDSSFLKVFAVKGRLSRRIVGNQPMGQETTLSQGGYKPISYAEIIRLFQAVSDHPLPFLDLRTRFGISKQTIRRLVKNGLLIEEWGPQAIGVRFKPSRKGKLYLKELEEAAKYELKMTKKGLIRLNRRTSF
jgi:DNA-binding Lrp family transcriptional regulator